MRKYILIDNAARKALISSYKVSRMTVWKALHYITNGRRPEQIRSTALLTLGGRYIEDDFIPNCQTEHSNGVIRQKFAGDVEVVLTDNNAVILVGGEKKEKFENVALSTWGNVLERAQSISESRMLSVKIM